MKKKKEQKKKRRILLALLMLLLTGVMTVTSTYAWFTANKTVTVNTINVNVAAANGIQISVDGVTWKPVITNQDILDTIDDTNANYPTNTNQFPIELNKLAPVSTAGTVGADGLMEMFLGEIGADEEGNYSLTATRDIETKSTEGNFIAFDLFFQVQTETEIFLTESAKVTAGDKGTGIQNAARVAFIQSDSAVGVGDGSTTIQELKGSSSIIWEPNIDVHTTAGVANAQSVYQKSTSTTGADWLEYNGVKAEIAQGVPLNDSTATYFEAVTPTIKTKASGIPQDTYQSVFTLQAGVSKVRVYLWVEGQDVDCENVASDGDIKFDLQFSSLKSLNG